MASVEVMTVMWVHGHINTTKMIAIIWQAYVCKEA